MAELLCKLLFLCTCIDPLTKHDEDCPLQLLEEMQYRIQNLENKLEIAENKLEEVGFEKVDDKWVRKAEICNRS